MADLFHCEFSRHPAGSRVAAGLRFGPVSSLGLAAVPVTRLSVVEKRQRADVTRESALPDHRKGPKQRSLSDPVEHVRGTKYRPNQMRPLILWPDLGFPGGRDRRRSGDLTLFRRALYQLSYPTSPR
jgi:hypothetical protein